jgi:hypothetical protein
MAKTIAFAGVALQFISAAMWFEWLPQRFASSVFLLGSLLAVTGLVAMGRGNPNK